MLLDNGLVPIGMFSRASFDRFTGYRSSTADQLAAAAVRQLRALDLPLDKVRQILHGRDPDLTRTILAGHQVAVQVRLAETERIVAELQSGIAPATHTPVHIRTEAAADTACVAARIAEAEFADWLRSAFERLVSCLDAAGITPAGHAGTLYDAEIADDLEYVEAFIPVAGPFAIPSSEREVSIGEVPAARVAVLVHAGDDYATMADTYVLGPSDVADPGLYRTEISWPIKGDAA